MDLLLTDYDMDLTNGDLSFVNGADAIGQDVTMRLRTWLGETVYDVSAGVPYLQVIFAERNPTAENVALHVAKRLAVELPAGAALECVEVEEAPGCVARYFTSHKTSSNDRASS